MAFPHHVLVNKVSRLKFTVCSSLDWREGRDEQSLLAFKATWTKKCLLKTADFNRVKKVFYYIRQQLIFRKSYFPCYKTPFFHIRNIAKLWNMLSVSDAEKLVHAFMTSRLDYCNALLGGYPASSINNLQIDHMIILLQFYSLCTGYLLSFVSVTKYYYLPIRP